MVYGQADNSLMIGRTVTPPRIENVIGDTDWTEPSGVNFLWDMMISTTNKPKSKKVG